MLVVLGMSINYIKLNYKYMTMLEFKASSQTTNAYLCQSFIGQVMFDGEVALFQVHTTRVNLAIVLEIYLTSECLSDLSLEGT